MGMIAAKHTDPIVGLDMHLVQPPPPAPPVMVPHPVAGIIMDPADYSPGACTVFINGLPRARAGNMCMMMPPHIPIGGMFVKPPLSEVELYQGSSTVTADGEALSALGHQVLGCHDIGAPAPVRPWKSGGAKSLMKAGSIALPIPGGPPVMVGGSPATSASGETAGELEVEEREQRVRFTFRFDSYGVERSDQPIEVRVDGALDASASRTSARGDVVMMVPLDATMIEVKFDAGSENESIWEIELHTLDGVDTDAGLRQRLANLGYLKGDPAACSAGEVDGALAAFCASRGLSDSTNADQVRARILEAHGS